MNTEYKTEMDAVVVYDKKTKQFVSQLKKTYCTSRASTKVEEETKEAVDALLFPIHLLYKTSLRENLSCIEKALNIRRNNPQSRYCLAIVRINKSTVDGYVERSDKEWIKTAYMHVNNSWNGGFGWLLNEMSDGWTMEDALAHFEANFEAEYDEPCIDPSCIDPDPWNERGY